MPLQGCERFDRRPHLQMSKSLEQLARPVPPKRNRRNDNNHTQNNGSTQNVPKDNKEGDKLETDTPRAKNEEDEVRAETSTSSRHLVAKLSLEEKQRLLVWRPIVYASHFKFVYSSQHERAMARVTSGLVAILLALNCEQPVSLYGFVDKSNAEVMKEIQQQQQEITAEDLTNYRHGSHYFDTKHENAAYDFAWERNAVKRWAAQGAAALFPKPPS